MLRIIASLGPRNGHTGLFPGDPAHTRELHLYPVRLYHFADGMYVVDATDTIARPEPARRDRGHPDRARARARRAARPARQHVEPSRAGAALPAHRRGARRPRSHRRHRSGRRSRSSSPTASASTSSLTPVAGARTRPRSPIRSSATIRRSCPRRRGRCTCQEARGRSGRGRSRVVAPSTSATTPSARRRPPFLRKIERLVRGEGVRRVIVDVRLNGGGDNTTYGSLTTLFGSTAVNKRGKLHVLIGRATFSAAANFAAEIDRATRAVFVGEPTGGGVETYADTFPVLLPTVGWTVRIAAQVPRAQEEQERSPARGRARRSRRPHLGAVLRRVSIPCSSGR